VSTEGRASGKRKPPQFLRAAERDRLLDLLERTANPRDKAIITLFLYSGLRLNELRMLDRHDIEWEERRIMVRFAKGGKWRRLSLNPKAADALRAYLATRRDPDPALFLSRNRRRMAHRSIQLMLEKFVAQLDLPKRITPHCLRHTFATHLLRTTGGDLRLVQRALGHSSIQTTVIYAQIEDTVLFDAMDNL
jgi:site-specific recombinase XerC